MFKFKRFAHLAGAYTLLAVTFATPALAANKLDSLASGLLNFVKVIVVCAFGWKAAEAAFKEKYSVAWVLVLLAALVGGLLFVGEPVFRWLWQVIQEILNG